MIYFFLKVSFSVMKILCKKGVMPAKMQKGNFSFLFQKQSLTLTGYECQHFTPMPILKSDNYGRLTFYFYSVLEHISFTLHNKSNKLL